MALLDLFLSRAIKRGEVTITHPDGTQRTFGTPDATRGQVGLRCADKGAIRARVRDPAIGAAEMYIAGRMLVDRGNLIDLLVLFTANNRWEEGSRGLEASPIGRMLALARIKLARYNSIRRTFHN